MRENLVPYSIRYNLYIEMFYILMYLILKIREFLIYFRIII